MEPFSEAPSEMAVSERVGSGVKHSSQRQRVQTKGCQKQKVASAAAPTSRGHQEEPQQKRQREKMVKIGMLGLKIQHL